LIVQRESISAGLDETEEQKSLLLEELAEAVEEANCNDNELAAIMQECEELELEIAHKNDIQTAMRHRCVDLKKKAHDLKHEVSTTIWTLHELEGKEEILRHQAARKAARFKSQIQIKLCGTKRKLEQHNIKVTRAKIQFSDGTIYRDLKVTMENDSGWETVVVEFKPVDHDMDGSLNEEAHQVFEEAKSLLLFVMNERREVTTLRDAFQTGIQQMEVEVDARENHTAKQRMSMVAVYKTARHGFWGRMLHVDCMLLGIAMMVGVVFWGVFVQ
jgi:chromosome segregation ATPase